VVKHLPQVVSTFLVIRYKKCGHDDDDDDDDG